MDMNLLTILCLDSGIDFRFEHIKNSYTNINFYALTFSNYDYHRSYQIREVDMDRLMDRVQFELESIWHNLFVPKQLTNNLQDTI